MIQLNNVTKKYGDLLVLDNLSLIIPDNEITVILGPSGCGKTTLLNLIAGIDHHFEGSINGIPEQTSYCFQEDRLLPWKNAQENVEFVLNDKKLYREKIKELFSMLDMAKYMEFPIEQLSGGMKQRVAIARAFVYPSDIILLDEPFKSLDWNLKQSIIEDTIKIIEKEQRTMVLVTHDLSEALYLADQIFILSEKPAVLLKTQNIDIKKTERTMENLEKIKASLL